MGVKLIPLGQLQAAITSCIVTAPGLEPTPT